MPLVTDKLQDVHQPGRVYPIDCSMAFEEVMGPDEMDDQLGYNDEFPGPGIEHHEIVTPRALVAMDHSASLEKLECIR